MKPKQHLMLAIMSNWAGLVLNVGISFFLAPFVVNSLGSTWYGIWAVTMQLTGYLYLLDFGVRESVIRYTSKYMARGQGRRLNLIITVALAVYGGITALAVLATAALAVAAPRVFTFDPTYHREAQLAIAFVGMTIAQTFIFNVYTGILLGLQRWATSNVINMSVAVIRAGLIVVALKAGYGIVALAAIQFFASTASGIVAWRLASSYLRQGGVAIQIVPMSLRRFRALGKRIVGYGFFVFLNNMGQKVIVASDAIVIAAFLPMSSVTYYAIAGSLIEPLRSLLISTAHVYAPIASRLHAVGDREGLSRVMLSGSRFVVLLALPVATTYIVLGRRFIGLWMGPEFMGPAGDVLVVLGITAILAAPSYVVGMVLYGISRHNISAYVKMVEAGANLALSLALVRTMGIVGVALGTAIPHAVVCLGVLPYATCRAIGYPFGRFVVNTFKGPVLAIVPFLLVQIWVNRNISITSLVAFFGIVAVLSLGYMILVYAWALEPDERSWLAGRLGLTRFADWPGSRRKPQGVDG